MLMVSVILFYVETADFIRQPLTMIYIIYWSSMLLKTLVLFLYADYSKIYKVFYNKKDHQKLQSVLILINMWSNECCQIKYR